MRFNIAGSVPAGATINSASLTLHCSRTNPVVNTYNFSLHRLLADWGEAGSDAGNPGGLGAPAMPGDATWMHRIFNTDLWTAAGGDFAAMASGTQGVGASGASYTWGSTAQMVADVQGWLDSPATNFGWILIGTEASAGSAKEFESRENVLDAQFRPKLTIEYTAEVPAVAGWGLSAMGAALGLTALLVLHARRRGAQPQRGT
jgi:hypothetical protein